MTATRAHHPNPIMLGISYCSPATTAAISPTHVKARPIKNRSAPTPASSSTASDAIASSRPTLASKFSSDNIANSTTTRMVSTKAWLQNIKAASARLPTTFAINSTNIDRAMVISPPALVHHAFGRSGVTNTELGNGARIIGRPSDAFRLQARQRHIDMPLPRTSKDSPCIVDPATSANPAPFLKHFRDIRTTSANRYRDLPQLPLRIASMSGKLQGVEVEVGCLAVDDTAVYGTRTESYSTDDSMVFSADRRFIAPGSISNHSNLSTCVDAPRSPAKRHGLSSIPVHYKMQSSVQWKVPTFRAKLLSSVSAFYMIQDANEQIVSLHIGSKVILTTVATLTQQPSHLGQYINDILEHPLEVLYRPAHSGVTSSKITEKLHLLKPDIVPAQVTIASPATPIAALRSSRASFLDDVPSDEGETDVEWLPSKHTGETLHVPSLSNPMDLHPVSSFATLTSHSSLDSTSDEEGGDAFRLQQPYLDFKKHISADAMGNSQPPSLSSSPSSSLYATIDMGMLHPLDAIRQNAARHLTQSVEILLDRSPEPYDAVLHWLRAGQLPHALQYSAACPDKLMLAELPASARTTLLPLLLHPVMSQLQALQGEAEYLGMPNLRRAAGREIALLQSLLKTNNITVTPTPPVSLLKLRAANSPTITHVRPTHRKHYSDLSVGQLAVVTGSSDGWI